MTEGDGTRSPQVDGALSARVGAALRDVPDFPEPGILFKDVTPLLADPEVFAAVIDDIAARHTDVELVAGIEARGFVFGAAAAYRLGVGFVPVRKAGKLPGETVSLEYHLEYGSAVIEIHEDAIRAGRRVLLVDDVLATGGTAAAAWDLLERVGAEVTAFEVVVELEQLGGRARMGQRRTRSIHRC